MNDLYVTTAIPYVNAAPHLGHALELVQADTLARHRRLRGHRARLLTGTDDNALKNVAAARAAGLPVREFVDGNARRFLALCEPLALRVDDFLRTSADPRHARGVTRLWQRTAANGDFYRRSYAGRYCAGCEQFFAPGEDCAEHPGAITAVAEENWFFRLSRYQDRILRLLESGVLRVEPAARRNEVLAFVRAGLADISVSRPAARGGGWGLPVPGDPGQVVYVWWDALANYVTALGDGPDFERWWCGPGERVHVVGKGIVRFHAVYWPALLLSAGLPLPSAIFVHDYLTAGGSKIAKSAGNAVDPVELVAAYGTDAVRWWLLREPARTGDTDFTVQRLVSRADQELAHGFGNLCGRVSALARRGAVADGDGLPGVGLPDAGLPDAGLLGDGPIFAGALGEGPLGEGPLGAGPLGAGPLDAGLPDAGLLGEGLVGAGPLGAGLAAEIDAALGRFDFRAATGALVAAVAEGNRYVEEHRPWELTGERFAVVVGELLALCRLLARELSPFLPGGAARLLTERRAFERLTPRR